MATAELTTCRRCPAKIAFLTTKGGRPMPVDADTLQPGDTEYDHTRHTSHFATCPAAAKFRKPKPELAMTMTFYNEPITERFVELCKKQGMHGTVATKYQGTRKRYRVTVNGFKNRTAMATFTATWAALTIERE